MYFRNLDPPPPEKNAADALADGMRLRAAVICYVWMTWFSFVRYKCMAKNGCAFETYLLRTLDTHVNHIHEAGKTASDVGYEDRGTSLQADWKRMGIGCFNEEVISHITSAVARKGGGQV